jgi:hypothetical protein
MINKLKNKLRFTILKHSRTLNSTLVAGSLIKWGILSLSLCLLCLVTGLKADAETKKPVDRELWRGTMNQSAPMEWSGPFELFLRYDSESVPPQALDGLTIWPTLGEAKIKIKGTWKSDNNFEFEEVECVAGDCSQVIIGGKYKASLDSKKEVLSGTAVGPMQLKGKFSAIRFRPRGD